LREDGSIFIQTNPDEPLTFTVGAPPGQGGVMVGMDKGMRGMKVGESREIVSEPADAFGERKEKGLVFCDTLPSASTFFPESGAEGPDLVLRSTGSAWYERRGSEAGSEGFSRVDSEILRVARRVVRRAPPWDATFGLWNGDSRRDTGYWV